MFGCFSFFGQRAKREKIVCEYIVSKKLKKSGLYKIS
jgi:hypothetical protein